MQSKEVTSYCEKYEEKLIIKLMINILIQEDMF